LKHIGRLPKPGIEASSEQKILKGVVLDDTLIPASPNKHPEREQFGQNDDEISLEGE
jgi:hypothetical protein